MGLKGIPQIISPELLFALAQMGHGDELVLADSNFPARYVVVHKGKFDGYGLKKMGVLIDFINSHNSLVQCVLEEQNMLVLMVTTFQIYWKRF